MDIVFVPRGLARLVFPSLTFFFCSLLFAFLAPSVYAQEAVPTRSQALAACNQAGSATVQYYTRNGYPGVFTWCVDEPAGAPPRFTCYADGREDGAPAGCAGGGLGVHFEYAPSQCADRPDQVNGWYVDQDPNTSNNVCNDGCAMDYSLTIDVDGSVSNVWSASGATCTTTDNPAPRVDTDGDGTPDDEDAFPNDPNEDTDTDGDGVGDNTDPNPTDPTDGADDGSGDESDNIASGGGTCAAAPTCSGDGIQCAQLYQQWRIRCASEGQHTNVAGAGGSCSTALVCNGDPIQCAQLRETRAARCSATQDPDDPQDPDSPSTSGDETASSSDLDVLRERQIGVADLDDSGWLARSCPAIPTFNLGPLGTFSPQFEGWCQLLDVLGGLLMLVAALTALRILVN